MFRNLLIILFSSGFRYNQVVLEDKVQLTVTVETREQCERAVSVQQTADIFYRVTTFLSLSLPALTVCEGIKRTVRTVRTVRTCRVSSSSSSDKPWSGEAQRVDNGQCDKGR